MTGNKELVRYWVILLIVLFAIASCGRKEDLEDDFLLNTDPPATDLTENPTTAPLATIEAQREIISVMDTIQNGIIGSLLPTTGIAIGKCEPDIDFVLIVLNISFDQTNGCNLVGDISVKLFPLSATVDLDVYGLKFIESLNFEADLVFDKQGNTVELGFEFLDGQIGIKSLSFLSLDDLIMNGKLALQFGGGVFGLSSRANIFDGTQGSGMAFITEIGRDNNTGVKTRRIQGCVLTGAVGDDPDAGNLSACFNLLK